MRRRDGGIEELILIKTLTVLEDLKLALLLLTPLPRNCVIYL